jgi:hypothetical protein
MSIEIICNQALDVIGYPRKIGNIYEGTKAARAFLNAWVETRDALLEKLEPDWAKRDDALTLLKSAPNIVNGTANYDTGWGIAYPPLPWLYEYAYPEDCISPLRLKESTLFLPIWRPRYYANRLNYELTGTQRTILANIPNAILTYVAVVANPDNWHNEFVELMIMALAKKAEAELMPARAAQRREAQQEQQGQQDGNAAG